MADSFEVSDTFAASPDRIYRAWLDSIEHGAMTGGDATADNNIGGSFTVMDGYIQGTNLELEPGRRIVQAWRTKDFPDGAPDSRLEIELSSDGDGTRITLRHTELPDGQGSDYEEGWREHYFDPMRKYFTGGETESMTAETTRMPAIAMPPADGWEPEEEPRRPDDVRARAKKAAAKKKASEAKAKPKAKVKAKAKAKPKAKVKAKAKAKPAKKKAAAPKKRAAPKAAPKKKAAKAKKKPAKAKKKGRR
jgi:uncharacterized protein YndB with AHSA1/START domain